MSRVGLITGGVGSEREISLLSARGVADSLTELGHEVYLFDYPQDRHKLVRHVDQLAFVMIILHGKGGEDGHLPALLDRLQVPYQGPSPVVYARCRDKRRTKAYWRQAGLPVCEDLLFDLKEISREDFLSRVEDFPLPCIVKSVCEGSSIGMAYCHTRSDLLQAYQDLREYGKVLVEREIQGREFTVGLLEYPDGLTETLPVVEIIPPEGEQFDYTNKYNGKTAEICPAQLGYQQEHRIKQIAAQAYRTVGCRGVGRVDLMMDQHGKVYLLEINTIPGLTAESLLPKAARAAGMSYTDMIEIMFHTGIAKKKTSASGYEMVRRLGRSVIVDERLAADAGRGDK